jgi:hypothetical protein
LANSTFGLVVLSSQFFAKNWTQYELNGLVSRENLASPRVHFGCVVESSTESRAKVRHNR